MRLDLVTFDNYKDAIRVQNMIFPHENGALNILASLDRSLFMNKTNLFYPDDGVKYYLAYVGEKIVGITGIYNVDNEAWLAWFGILFDLRNRGYGKQLLEETMNLAKRNGYRVLRLYTDKVENAEAVKLYEKVGFIGEKYSFEKLPYDCWIYSKSLDDGKVEPWDNKNLDLLYQSDLDHMDDERINEILNMYEELS